MLSQITQIYTDPFLSVGIRAVCEKKKAFLKPFLIALLT